MQYKDKAKAKNNKCNFKNCSFNKQRDKIKEENIAFDEDCSFDEAINLNINSNTLYFCEKKVEATCNQNIFNNIKPQHLNQIFLLSFTILK